MLKVWLEEKPAPPELFEVEDLCAFLADRYAAFPATGKIYHGQVAESNDVTPAPGDERAIEHLQQLEGTFYVVIYPEGPLAFSWPMFWAALAASAVSMAVSYLLQPKQPAAGRNRNNESPNGSLSERANGPRVNGRIADIYGTGWSTPDMNHRAYTIFVNNREVEICSEVIGRGYYTIHKALNGQTPAAEISGTSIEIYNPYTSANSGDEPFFRIGDPINTPLVRTTRSKSVTGQVLRAPNDNKVTGADSIIFVWPDSIRCTDPDIDFTDKFEAGEVLIVTNAYVYLPAPIGEGDTVSFGGNYTILSVTSDTVVLSNPATVNSYWAYSSFEEMEESPAGDAVLNVNSPRYTDWVTLDVKDLTGVYANYFAAGGMYKDDGKNQKSTSVDVELEVVPIDADGVEIGDIEVFPKTVTGSANDRQTKGATIEAFPTFTGRCKARSRRITPRDFEFAGVVVDEVQLRDLFAVSPETKLHFGNVTTVQIRTEATRSALSIEGRQDKFLVTRRLPRHISGATFTTELYDTNNFADILSAVSIDPYIGNRSPEEIDFDLIYSVSEEIEQYFGTPLAAEFCDTFSADNMSYEETVSAICRAVFCGDGFRQGSRLKCHFERETDDSVLLFCHRNKVPQSEKRTETFGFRNDNDGIELEYRDPEDDAIVTLYIPEDRSALKPLKVTTVGVRNHVQAHFHAWREWGKLRYQHTVCEFTGCAESKYLALNHRILVADNTRPDVQDGEIRSQNGLVLETSQPLIFDPAKSYVVFLQLYDATVESIACGPGADKYHLVLAEAPRLPLTVDDEAYAKTTYLLTDDTDGQAAAFLVGEVAYDGPTTSTVTCGNYDARFYAHDADFKLGLIEE